MSKRCTKCLLEQPLSSFTKCASFPDGLEYWCRTCKRTHHAAFRATDAGKESARRSRLRRYGITPEQYDKQLDVQKGTCAVCAASSERLHVDHDHTTGRIRGLLCHQCNRALGLLRDRVETLVSAAHYLLSPPWAQGNPQ